MQHPPAPCAQGWIREREWWSPGYPDNPAAGHWAQMVWKASPQLLLGGGLGGWLGSRQQAAIAMLAWALLRATACGRRSAAPTPCCDVATPGEGVGSLSPSLPGHAASAAEQVPGRLQAG